MHRDAFHHDASCFCAPDRSLGAHLPKPIKTSRCLTDSVFHEPDEASKGAERRPTAQKGGAYAPPNSTPFQCLYEGITH